MMPRARQAAAVIGISLSTLLFPGTASKGQNARETIVFVRHGEKPEAGLGQITCQGLNRALALPAVIAKKFGKPEAIFAPDPSQRKKDAGELYDYVRPLATIEPTAITFGLPVQTGIGVWDRDGLQAALEQQRYENAFILIAWEHKMIEATARALIAAHGGDPTVVPKWRGDDFDSIYVVTIAATGDGKKASFALEHQGLDGQSEVCPSPTSQMRAQCEGLDCPARHESTALGLVSPDCH